jgi:HD domain
MSTVQGRAEPCCSESVSRRSALRGAVMWLLMGAVRAEEQRPGRGSPVEVAGIEIPTTALALSAAALARSACPPFLYNHCMRTYLLGALSMQSRQAQFDRETAFVAASLHDLGLLPSFASARASFEVDGANRAERLMRDSGRSPEQGRRVWNAIVAHDMSSAYAEHQSPEAVLVNAGAGADVVGPGDLEAGAVAEVIRAYPRLEFKTRFTALLVDHCRRKPTSEIGWLDGLCRGTAPNASRPSVKREILDAPYKE